jgi:hypothetical protein
MIVLDIDHISVLQYRDSPNAVGLQARLEAFPLNEVGTTAITVEEQMRGWLGLINRYTDVHRQLAYYDRLSRSGISYGLTSRPLIRFRDSGGNACA